MPKFCHLGPQIHPVLAVEAQYTTLCGGIYLDWLGSRLIRQIAPSTNYKVG